MLKTVGLAHKSEAGGVRLHVPVQDAAQVARDLPGDVVLIEEMVQGGLAEVLADMLVGVLRDPAHGFVLTPGAVGVLTELRQDTQSLLVPATGAEVRSTLHRLRIWPLLAAYRGKPAVDIEAVVAAIEAVQAYVVADADTVDEVEVNPLICTVDRAVAADALIRKT